MKQSSLVLGELKNEHQTAITEQELDGNSLDPSKSLKQIINPRIIKMNESSDSLGLFSEGPLSFMDPLSRRLMFIQTKGNICYRRI